MISSYCLLKLLKARKYKATIGTCLFNQCQFLGFKRILIKQNPGTQVTILEIYEVCNDLPDFVFNYDLSHISFIDELVQNLRLPKSINSIELVLQLILCFLIVISYVVKNY